ncbi:MAG: hypothetical protein EOP10_33730 [Proteobacteria bacterium]|nr:MAG: hypothetical protein EOP10_33730 [Pseudomonadota bacterium]
MSTHNLYLLPLVLFTTLSLNISCSKDHDPKSANEPVAQALDLHVPSLADTSVERSCTELYEALKDFSASYLPGTEVVAGEGFFNACDQRYHDENLPFSMGFVLKNADVSLKLHIAVNRTIDANRNVTGTNLWVSRMNEDKNVTFVPLQAEKALGENMIHLTKSLEAWAAPANKPLA